MAGFWSDVGRSFKETRRGQYGPRRRERGQSPEEEQGADFWTRPGESERCPTCAEREREVSRLTAMIASGNAVQADLMADVNRLTGERDAARKAQAAPKPDPRFNKLKMAVGKCLNPETASDPALASALERRFRELEAEIARIEAS